MRHDFGRWVKPVACLAFFAAAGRGWGSDCPAAEPAGVTATYPGQAGSAFQQPLTYPKTSDRYSVQYQRPDGTWASPRVYASYYGGSMSTPYLSTSKYLTDTSFSFVNIEGQPNEYIPIRVTKLFGGGFQPGSISVRPSSKPIAFGTLNGAAVITALTPKDFNGEQFILWWDEGNVGGAVEALAFFINPTYPPPTTGNIKIVSSWDDIKDSKSTDGYDTLIFTGFLQIGGTGAAAYTVPDNIDTIFFAEDAWVQGKLRFKKNGTALRKKWIHGTGVLDVSRFNYSMRVCSASDGYRDEGLNAISATDGTSDKSPLVYFLIDGIAILDHNHAATNTLADSVVNNVKTLGWNAVNGGLRIGDHTTVTNEFIRSGDDSLMVWGSNISVTNSTVWQNYNGGVVNLGWSNNSKGEGIVIDSLYVIKTDWHTPTTPTFDLHESNTLADQNNAVIASMTTPGTNFDPFKTSVFRNIFVEESPQVLFSVKIMPAQCGLIGLGSCPGTEISAESYINLDIENLYSPPSLVSNSFGFDTLIAPYVNQAPNGRLQILTSDYQLKGTMNIRLKNVMLETKPGVWVPLTDGPFSPGLGQIVAHGNVNFTFF
jgi:hypothetical protein